jgi:UDP-N-acetylmuramate--alanine ligase
MTGSDREPLPSSLHFVGIGGSGMSALAQLHALAGDRVTGSDRAFDQGQRAGIRAALERLGVTVLPQDGSGPRSGCAAAVLSTAVEDTIPDVRAARERGVPLLHRSELLARHVARHRTVAVTGTSGKSTVTAMIFALLRGVGAAPALLTGGPVVDLQVAGYLGNAWAGPERPDGDAVPAGADAAGAPTDGSTSAPTGDARPWLVIEADESDGSLVRYRPWAGVVLNLGRDHKEPDEVARMFATFRERVAGPFVVGDTDNLAHLRRGAVTFGFEPGCDLRAEDLRLGPFGSRFRVNGVDCELRQPGRHNVLNALAALATARACGFSLPDLAGPLAHFGGVARRFQSLGAAGGVEVIDDFAPNGDKLAAAIATAHDRLGAGAGAGAGSAATAAAATPGGRVLAVFQPHGFRPTRFLRDDLVAALRASLSRSDVIWLPEIYYAGGTVERDISSADLAAAVRAGDRDARFVADREGLPDAIAAEAEDGDLVLIMGARDPSLTDLGRGILAALSRRTR